jgi:hypothetical protein
MGETEWKGPARISEIVHEMGCIWREMTTDDYGLDGEIEFKERFLWQVSD